MPLSASTAPWQPPSRSRLPRSLAVAGAAITGAVVALIAAQWIAGYLFLWWLHLQPRGATPLTITRYAYYYGHRDDVRRRLAFCSALGLALVTVPFTAMRDSQHAGKSNAPDCLPRRGSS